MKPLGTIVFCAAEAAPFAKVGGLGDVAGSLPKALKRLGMNPVIVLPRYGFINPHELGFERLPLQLEVSLLGSSVSVGVWKGALPGLPNNASVPVYLIEHPTYFGTRQTVYSSHLEEDIQSFLLLSKAVFPLMKALKLPPDILHVHDWHTAAAAIDLLEFRQADPFFQHTQSVLTIHNIAYQGVSGPGELNWLGEGLRLADFITAVSPTYATEIQTPEGGAGLHQVIRQRSNHLKGILNGIDTDLFNPMTDAFIPETYNRQTFHQGKRLCKRVLQQELGLEVHPEIPLIGMVTRLVEQKGLDILLPVMDLLASRRAQWIFLGSGEPGYEALLKELNGRYRNMVSYVGFNLALGQKIYAGSDIFLMPSRFEPCGLGQLIALRYGAVPLVRETGGLADTVIDLRKSYEVGNGFSFAPYESGALLETVDTALSYFKDETTWQHLVQNGMAEDYSWERSAKQYRNVYQKLKQR